MLNKTVVFNLIKPFQRFYIQITLIQIFLNQKNLTMKKLLILTSLFTLFVSAAFSQEIPLEQWSKNHPKASEELGGWVKRHPRTAHVLFEWDSRHPERSQEFVNWCIVHS